MMKRVDNRINYSGAISSRMEKQKKKEDKWIKGRCLGVKKELSYIDKKISTKRALRSEMRRNNKSKKERGVSIQHLKSVRARTCWNDTKMSLDG
jgi:hypothetical protein